MRQTGIYLQNLFIQGLMTQAGCGSKRRPWRVSSDILSTEYIVLFLPWWNIDPRTFIWKSCTLFCWWERPKCKSISGDWSYTSSSKLKLFTFIHQQATIWDYWVFQQDDDRKHRMSLEHRHKHSSTNIHRPWTMFHFDIWPALADDFHWK